MHRITLNNKTTGHKIILKDISEVKKYITDKDSYSIEIDEANEMIGWLDILGLIILGTTFYFLLIMIGS